MSLSYDDFFKELHTQLIKKSMENTNTKNELLIHLYTIGGTRLLIDNIDSYKALGLVFIPLKDRAVFKFFVVMGLDVCICNTGIEAIDKYNKNKQEYAIKNKLDFIPIDTKKVGNTNYSIPISNEAYGINVIANIFLSKNCNVGNTSYTIYTNGVLSTIKARYKDYLEYKKLIVERNR